MAASTDLHDRLHAVRRRGLELARRFDARPRRERIALVLAALALALLLADRLWLSPAFQAFTSASRALSAARAEQQALADETAHRHVQGEADRRALDAEIGQWRQRTSQGAQGLADVQAGLIGPDRMAALLEQMLPRQGGVKVVGLTTLAPQDARTPLGARPGTAAPAPATAASAGLPAGDGAPLYRHGVEITVEGGYGALMGWLSSLEALPGPRLLWGGVKLDVEQHPTVRLSLTVYTLSLDRTWLEL